MAETFKRAGGPVTSAGSLFYETPSAAGDVAVILSCSVSNTSGSVYTVSVDVCDANDAVISNLITDAGIAPNTGLEIVQNKLILEAGEKLKLTAGSGANTLIHATIGILEITS